MICGAFSYGSLFTNANCGTTFELYINGSCDVASFCNNFKMPMWGGSNVPWEDLTVLKVYSNCIMCASDGAIQVLGLKRGSSDIGVA